MANSAVMVGVTLRPFKRSSDYQKVPNDSLLRRAISIQAEETRLLEKHATEPQLPCVINSFILRAETRLP